MQQPLISVITPTYNAGATLQRAIESVVSQKFGDFEIVIMDGLSTDNSLEIARSFNDERIKITSEKDKGIYDAMNKALVAAAGKYFFFLGSDDYLIDDEVFQKVADILLKEKPDLLYGNVYWGSTDEVYGMKYNRERLLYSNICHQAMFYKSEVFDELGNFDLKYRTCADWDFNFRLFDAPNKKLIYKNMIVSFFTRDGISGTVRDHDIYTLLDERKNAFYQNRFYRLKKRFSSFRSDIIDLIRGRK